MRLTDIFQNQKTQSPDVELNKSADNILKNLQNGQLKNLTPGQTITGQVVQMQGSDVQIKLLENILVQAKLSDVMNLEQGKNITFEVRGNGKTLTLSPLFANMAADENVYKALQMANLPVNEESVALTGQMMANKLPIDKNSLTTAYQELKGTQNAEVLDIVDLHRMQIPVTRESVEQVANYHHFTHQLIDGMSQIAEGVPALLTEMLENNQEMQAGELLMAFADLAAMDEEAAGENLEKVAQREAAPTEQNPAEAEKLAGNVKNADGIENLSLKDAFSMLKRAVGEDNPQNREQIRHLLADLDFPKQIMDKIKDKWLLTPDKLQEENKVSEEYQKLFKQLQTMESALTQSGQTSTPVYEQVKGMQQNLDFLNQMNQMFAYVQLPLKLDSSEAHGDLYVYSKKKNLSAKDGEISAFLHLDMEHLGPVDVQVKMLSEKVTTQFMVASDEMLDFLEAHMSLLTDRLNKKGYLMEVSMKTAETTEDERGALAPVLGSTNENGVALSHLSFDVRA